MATTNPSLFGMLGDEAAMQRQLDEQRAQAFAQQTQEQRLAGMGYSAGAGLGRGIAGAFGVDVTDPVVRQATQLRQLASEFDTTTPEGMMKFAQAARSISHDVAQKAAQEAQAMQLKSAEITAKTAEKMTPEERNAQKLSEYDIAIKALTPYAKDNEGIAAQLDMLTTKRDRLASLTAKETKTSYGPEADRLSKALYGKDFRELTQDQANTVDKQLELRGLTKATASRQTINLPPQPKAEQEERGKMLVNQYKDVSKQASIAARTLPALESSLNILDKGFDTGFGTETLATGAKVLAALGVEDAKSYATNAQSFLGAASQAVLTRQLEQKGPQTESDAARITQTGAQLGNTKEANRFLVSVAKAQFKRDIDQRAFYDKWFKEYKTYDGAEDAWFNGEGGKSLFDSPELMKYKAPVSSAGQIPTQVVKGGRTGNPLIDKYLPE
jgi:hypothetical protein